MFADLIVCFILYYLFFILEDTTQAAVVAPEPITENSDHLDDWEPESEGGITLPCATPSPPLDSFRTPSPDTLPDTILKVIHSRPDGYLPYNWPEEDKPLHQTYQEFVDSQEQNWWRTPHGIFRHPFPTVAKGRGKARRYWKVKQVSPQI